MAYRLNLSTELEYVHNVFHISQLQKYVLDSNDIIEPKPIEIAENLAYEQHRFQMLDHRIKQLHNKSIPLVKVLWANHGSSKSNVRERGRHEKQVSLLVQGTFYSFENETYFKRGSL